MTLLIPNGGEVIAINAFLNKTAGQDQTLILYQNNITPSETDVTATYTEATFTGYASKALTGANWTTTPGAPTQSVYAIQTYTSTADQTLQNIYGYMMKQTTSGLIMLAERFAAAPYAITNNGDNIAITPQVTFD
jgi:hypothetical protein